MYLWVVSYDAVVRVGIFVGQITSVGSSTDVPVSTETWYESGTVLPVPSI